MLKQSQLYDNKGDDKHRTWLAIASSLNMRISSICHSVTYEYKKVEVVGFA
jgi:hypothetical protein